MAASREHLPIAAEDEGSPESPREADAAVSTQDLALLLQEVKGSFWRWPTYDKWFSHLEGVWRTVRTSTGTETESQVEGADKLNLHHACPFDVTTMVSEENKHLMPDVVVTIRSPYLISLLRSRMPAVLADALCSQKPEIDAKDLFFVWSTLRDLPVIGGQPSDKPPAAASSSSSSEEEDPHDATFWSRLHLRHLLRFLDEHFADASAKFQRMKSLGLVSYKLLWAFLTPGTEVRHLCSLTGTHQYCVVHSRGKYVDRTYSPDDNCFKLKLVVMDYNGESYRQCTVKERIREFDGEVPFQSLPLCPLFLYSDGEREALERHFLHRGSLFYAYAVRDPFRYMQYKGSMGFYERNQTDGKFQQRRVNADGRVMVDLLSTARANPDWPLGNAQPPSELMRVYEMGRRSKDGVRVSRAEPTEEELKWAPAGVFGFSFSLKKWGCFDVVGLEEVSFNEKAYEQLVMRNAKQKEMLRAMVSTKLLDCRDQGVYQYHEEEEEEIEGGGEYSDVVAEKGEGFVVLCYGPPGTGKTLTAEALAETLHKPLWRISAFELGHEPADMERSLGQALTTASRWRALVLLDEADAYLERRSHNVDIKRNLLTGVFLRLLEYHDGVLFLTTNRVSSFDTAILSRVSFSIRYAPLDDHQRRSIWRTLLHRAGAAPQAMAHDVIEELLHRSSSWRALNGREIRNVVALARTWAGARAGESGRAAASPQLAAKTAMNQLEVEHVRDALELFLAGSQELLHGFFEDENQTEKN